MLIKKLLAVLATCAFLASGTAQAAYDLTTFNTGASGGGYTSVSSNSAAMVSTSWISKAVYNVTSFDWYFGTSDYMPYNDYGYVSLNGAQTVLANVASVGNYGNSGWQTYTFGSAFTGLLEFGSVNYADSLYDSVLYVQNVAVVPEPETYAMLLIGLGLIGFMVRRRAEDFNF
ncbi:MAG: PEP-CTERM sorting domain-containing protein [Pseudomonadota bacterium]